MTERTEVAVLLTVASLCASAALVAWCVSPWWAALLVSVPLLPMSVALFGMAWWERSRGA